MGLDISIINDAKDKRAHLHWGYGAIHILRNYACAMVDAKEEESPEAREHFPNLVWHSDAEGYYVGILPDESWKGHEKWNEQCQLWVGSTEHLYEELQRISAHMIQNAYEGEAREVLQRLLKLFAEVEYDPEEDSRYTIIIFH